MAAIVDHTVRVLDQEIDTVDICSSYTDYMVVGTYSLVKKDPPVASAGSDPERQAESARSSSIRVGSVRILPVEHHTSVESNGAQLELARYDLPCAVLDVRFCPTNDSLLGVATSIGELRFFHVVREAALTGNGHDAFQIHPLGIARVVEHGHADIDEEHIDAERDQGDEALPLITQFAWIRNQRPESPQEALNHDPNYYLATCDTSGQTRILCVKIPQMSRDEDLPRSSNETRHLPCTSLAIHKQLYNLEAWTVLALSLSDAPDTSKQLVLSGGDDSCFIASSCVINTQNQALDSEHMAEEPLLAQEPIRILLDKHTHHAGVVAIQALPPLSDPTMGSTFVPVLTGSYDQHLRLYLLSTTTLKLTSVPDVKLELDGGVWRIALLDTYTILSVDVRDEVATTNFVLLVSAMHAGAYIVRLTCRLFDKGGPVSSTWNAEIEARFQHPHESMVYACAASRVRGHSDSLVWRVVSTSFYDKRICVWAWEDAVKGCLDC